VSKIFSLRFGLNYFNENFKFAHCSGLVAAFRASNGKAHPRVVELAKPEEILGFNDVRGGRENKSPILISRIIPGGVADRHGE